MVERTPKPPIIERIRNFDVGRIPLPSTDRADFLARQEEQRRAERAAFLSQPDSPIGGAGDASPDVLDLENTAKNGTYYKTDLPTAMVLASNDTPMRAFSAPPARQKSFRERLTDLPDHPRRPEDVFMAQGFGTTGEINSDAAILALRHALDNPDVHKRTSAAIARQDSDISPRITKEPAVVKNQENTEELHPMVTLPERPPVQLGEHMKRKIGEVLFVRREQVAAPPTAQEQLYVDEPLVKMATDGLEWFTDDRAVAMLREMRGFLFARAQEERDPRPPDAAVYDEVKRAVGRIQGIEGMNEQVLRDLTAFLQRRYAHVFRTKFSGIDNGENRDRFMPVLLMAYGHAVRPPAAEAA